jgi:hypothetical protein
MITLPAESTRAAATPSPSEQTRRDDQIWWIRVTFDPLSGANVTRIGLYINQGGVQLNDVGT